MPYPYSYLAVTLFYQLWRILRRHSYFVNNMDPDIFIRTAFCLLSVGHSPGRVINIVVSSYTYTGFANSVYCIGLLVVFPVSNQEFLLGRVVVVVVVVPGKLLFNHCPFVLIATRHSLPVRTNKNDGVLSHRKKGQSPISYQVEMNQRVTLCLCERYMT